MNGESLEEFYGGLLGVDWPWEVEEIIRDKKAREVRAIVAYIEGESPPCPTCGKASPIHDRKLRKWRHLDSCNHKTIIESEIPRVKCGEHGVQRIPVPWAERNSRFTQELERQVCMWPQAASIKEVASMFDTSWDAVAGIQGRTVRRGLERRKEAAPKAIGIDETSFQKRHEYVTVILDKDDNTLLDILQDRKAETLDGWFKTRQTADFKGLDRISMEMWDAFIKVVRDNFEGWESLIAFDRYHVAQDLNKTVDKVRANEHQESLKTSGTSELNGAKHDWLRMSAKTDNRTGDRPAFMQLSRRNLRTARAWRIKEAASLLWNLTYLSLAERRWKELLAWISRSESRKRQNREWHPSVVIAKSLLRSIAFSACGNKEISFSERKDSWSDSIQVWLSSSPSVGWILTPTLIFMKSMDSSS